jgi:hypothetical protein
VAVELVVVSWWRERERERERFEGMFVAMSGLFI